MANFTLQALNDAGAVVDTTMETSTGPGSFGDVTNLFLLRVAGPHTFAAITSETAPYEIVSAPNAETAPTISGTTGLGDTVTLNEGTYNGTTPITITFTLTLDGVDVTGDVVGNTYSIPAGTGGQRLVYTETASNGIAPDAVQTAERIVMDWTPADLFGAGEAGFAMNTEDVSNANTLSDGSGAAPVVGDPVGRLPGSSPNAETAVQADPAQQPILRQDANSRFYLECGTTKAMEVAEDITSGTWTIWMVYEPTGDNFILLSKPDNAGPWTTVGANDSTSTRLHDGSTSTTIWLDSTQFAGTTRDDVWTAAQGANLIVREGTHVGGDWQIARIGNYNNGGSYGPPGNVYAWGMINRTLTAQERTELLAYANRVRGA